MTKKRFGLLLLVILLGGGALAYYEITFHCRGPGATLACLKKNWRGGFGGDYERVWDVYATGLEKAQSCQRMAEVAEFLDLAGEGDAHLAESIDEDILNFFLNDSRCFLEAYLITDNNTQKNIIALLQNPIFVEEQTIQQEASKYTDDPRFKDIIQAILSAH